MPVFRTYGITFEYTRHVTVYVEAESEDAVFDFLETNEDWEPLGEIPEWIDEDSTVDTPDFEVFDGGHTTADLELVDGDIRQKDGQ